MNQPVVLQAGELKIGFEQRGDRWRHWIEIQVADTPRGFVRLESIECLPADAWPSSPPLQSIHIEQRPHDVVVALLVGMAGTSHWSLSVEVDPGASTASFDAACRTRGDAASLRSTYRICQGTMPDRVKTVHETSLVRTGSDELCFQPALVESDGVRTVRWGYVFRCDVTK